MSKGLWAGLSALGIAAGASAYGLYRIVILYYDFGPAAGELPAATEAYRAAGLPFLARDVAPPHLEAGQDATGILRMAIKTAPKRAVADELSKAARNPGPAADPILAKYALSLSTSSGRW